MIRSVSFFAKMSATPPPPNSPLPVDADDSLEEIDSLTGKEKFRALQKRLSSSSTMYSSPVSLSSGSESPPPAAPPPYKKPHVVEDFSITSEEGSDSVFVEEEKEASSRAKKLTHATKDRPKRKVRQPSRGKIREEVSNGSFEEHPVEFAEEPQPDDVTMQESGLGPPPSLPPMPDTPPPPPTG